MLRRTRLQAYLRSSAIRVVARLILDLLWKSESIAASAARRTAGMTGRPGILYSVLCVQTVVATAILFFEWALQESPPSVLYMAF